jgi:hypothetical protein
VTVVARSEFPTHAGSRGPTGPARSARHLVGLHVAVPVLRLLVATLLVGAVGGTLTSTTAVAGSSSVLELVDQTAWVGSEGVFELRLRAGAPEATLQVRVFPAVTGRIRFDQSIRGENLGAPLRPLPPDLPLDAVPRGADGAVTVAYPITTGDPGPFGIRLTESGVYPVSVALVDAGGEVLDRLVTHLIRLPTDGERALPLAVALVAPFHAPVAHAPDGTPTLPDGQRDRLGRLADLVAGAPTVPLTLEITPETLDAVADADRADGGDTVATLRSALLGRQVLARPYVDLDWGSWVTEGDPVELDGQLTAGSDTLTRALGIRPDPAAAVLDPTVTPDALTRMGETGVRRVAIPDDQVGLLPGEAEADPLTTTFLVEDGAGAAVPAAAADRDLGARLVETDDVVLNAHLTLADLAVLHGYAPNAARGVVLELPNGGDVPPDTVAALLDGLGDRTAGPGTVPVVSPVTLDTLFAVTDPATTADDEEVAVRGYEAEPPGSLDPLPTALTPVRGRLDGFRSMVSPDLEPAVPFERSLLIAGADGFDAARRQAYVDGAALGIDAALAGVVVPDQQRVTLTSATGNVPLSLDNTLTYPVTVTVALRSAKLAFPDGSEQTVVLPPGPTRLEVAVETKASGAFPVDVEVRSPDQVLLVGQADLTVRSTAISGLGLALSVAAGSFLLLWWVRHFRNVRRNRLLVAAGHPSTQATAGHGTTPGAAPRERARPSARLPTFESGRPGGEHARSPHRH